MPQELLKFVLGPLGHTKQAIRCVTVTTRHEQELSKQLHTNRVSAVCILAKEAPYVWHSVQVNAHANHQLA